MKGMTAAADLTSVCHTRPRKKAQKQQKIGMWQPCIWTVCEESLQLLFRQSSSDIILNSTMSSEGGYLKNGLPKSSAGIKL